MEALLALPPKPVVSQNVMALYEEHRIARLRAERLAVDHDAGVGAPQHLVTAHWQLAGATEQALRSALGQAPPALLVVPERVRQLAHRTIDTVSRQDRLRERCCCVLCTGSR